MLPCVQIFSVFFSLRPHPGLRRLGICLPLDLRPGPQVQGGAPPPRGGPAVHLLKQHPAEQRPPPPAHPVTVFLLPPRKFSCPETVMVCRIAHVIITSFQSLWYQPNSNHLRGLLGNDHSSAWWWCPPTCQNHLAVARCCIAIHHFSAEASWVGDDWKQFSPFLGEAWQEYDSAEKMINYSVTIQGKAFVFWARGMFPGGRSKSFARHGRLPAATLVPSCTARASSGSSATSRAGPSCMRRGSAGRARWASS